ncbi:restriction endonuclease subunit S [Raoultella planticola]|uniref:restriction endonuclease subunit S n=1 Tax=Raoultella planticola TaxID=575 RepID=UPI001C9DFA13|nr:restriction endonuclease subunit S [Raoultella planticola]MDM9675436.1 restriction endonuclease subunit S [Raoultella planticola]QZS63723.1 restriction endonuclease subunit S [Raoultella planticola]
MGSKIEEFQLSDRCTIKSSKRIFAHEYVHSGIPFWRSKDVIDKSLGCFNSHELFISKERFIEISKIYGHPQKGDLLISSVGNRSGQPYIVQDEGDFYFKDGNILWISDFRDLDPDFLSYWLKSEKGQSALSQVMIGSAQKALTIDALRTLKVSFPKHKQQINIAKIFKTLDNKILLARTINQTLEQMSQTLFKSWFVDFDPVIDNALDAGTTIPDMLQSRAELRQKVRNSADFKPLRADIRALFPAEFEETELGWVPKGWTLESVAKAININPSVKLPQNTIAKYVDMKSLPTQGYSISEVIEKPYAGGAKFQKNDTLFARITPCLENGKTGFVDFLDEKEIAFGSTEFIVMRGNTKVHYSYVACLARENNFRSHAIQNMVGSSGRQRVQNSCFDSFYIAIPTPSVMSLFAGKVSSYFDKMYSCNLENKSLTNLRDTLLPKLISGELSLEDLPNLVAQTEPA